MLYAALAIIPAALVGVLVWFMATEHTKKEYEKTVGSAEAKSREIIEEALKTAETTKREAVLKAQEENLKSKNDLDREIKDRRAEVQRYEQRVLSKEENQDKIGRAHV